ncbi:hypothetical protein EC844_1162 [Acinetobacter calcoaceticus]|uniref:Transmembrane protein n=1 Tax=Acinetobacter calcoaceticus TaxID=471 RepID=A0A4R1XNL8_ACICA|nr:hypothetical protein EC844_1162 [Acinetobacter calcoaceticus]
MLIPDFWAEATQQYQRGKRKVTVKRFGWSNESHQDALSMAQSRVAEALKALEQGEKVHLRELKSAYNGAFGVPIREQVLARHGVEVISRNSYGARCLNSPRALFADIDFIKQETGSKAMWIFLFSAILMSVMAWWIFQNGWLRGAWVVFSIYFTFKIAMLYDRHLESKLPDPVVMAKQSIDVFLKQHPKWNLRLYRSPNGLRLLATHQEFDPQSSEVQDFFAHIGADPIYARMCTRQNCFRARLTAKPWRIEALKSRPNIGVWPINPVHQQAWNSWLGEYERQASQYASCHYLESMGSGLIHPQLAPVVDLHDRLSQANRTSLEIA